MDDEYGSRDRQRMLSHEVDKIKDMLLTPAEKRMVDFYSIVFCLLLVIVSELFFSWEFFCPGILSVLGRFYTIFIKDNAKWKITGKFL